MLPKIGENLARYIGFTTFRNGGDIRGVLSIGKLIHKNDGPMEVDGIINTLLKYGKEVISDFSTRIKKANNSISYILGELCNRNKVLSDIRCFRNEMVEIVKKNGYCNSGLI